MKTSTTAALTAVTAVTMLAGPAQAVGRYDRCEPVVESELSRLQLDPARIGETSIQIRTYNDRNDETQVSGVLAWVKLRDCTGRLVVDLTSHCRVEQTYTTGSCSVAGVPAY